jgi:hypothetical protein
MLVNIVRVKRRYTLTLKKFFLSVVTTQQFHLVFVEFILGDYYLIVLIEEFIQSEYIQTKSFSSYHCIFINELLNNILKVA